MVRIMKHVWEKALAAWALVRPALRTSARRAYGIALEWLYPSSIYCMSCGNLIDESRPYALCDACMGNFIWATGKNCGKCGTILNGAAAQGTEPALCGACADGERAFEKGFACVAYSSGREVVRRFKYGGRAYYGEKIARILYDRLLPELPGVDLVLTVPMYRRKERKRGYNQADLAGRPLAQKLGLPYAGDVLLRTRRTEAMSRLGTEERNANVKGAFAVAPDKAGQVSGKRILLVDDIFTTGSTVEACAEALLSAGAGQVYFAVFAIGSDDSSDSAAVRVCG